MLLAPGSKRPAGATWTKTDDPVVITQHVTKRGNLGLCAKDSKVAVIDVGEYGSVDFPGCESGTERAPTLDTLG